MIDVHEHLEHHRLYQAIKRNIKDEQIMRKRRKTMIEEGMNIDFANLMKQSESSDNPQYEDTKIQEAMIQEERVMVT